MNEYGGQASLIVGTLYLFLRWGVLLLTFYVPLTIGGYEFPEVSIDLILGLTFATLVYTIVRQGLCNNSVSFDEKKVTFQGLVPLFTKKTSYDISEIQEVTMRDEWTETVLEKVPKSSPKIIQYLVVILILIVLPVFFPPDYKWIRIKSPSGKKTFYCFNLTTYDYGDDRTYHEVYKEFKDRGVNVHFT